MNTVSVMLMSVVSLVLPSTVSAGPILGVDTASNGRYWWGGHWSHSPKHGGTASCVCVLGTMLNGREEAACSPNGWPAGHWIPFELHGWDASKPVEIANFGSDALWVDRFQWGSKWFGQDNTSGWCLSTDRNDGPFDRWATIYTGKCYMSLVLLPASGHAHAPSGGFYYHRMKDAAQEMCRDLGRRRVEKDAAAAADSFDADVHDFEGVLDKAGDHFDALMTEAGKTLDVAPGFDGSNFDVPLSPLSEMDREMEQKLDQELEHAHDKLRDRLVKLVSERDSITGDELDEILDHVMLDVEHEEEREAHDGETEELDAETIFNKDLAEKLPEEPEVGSTGLVAPNPPTAIADELENTGVHSVDPPAHKVLRDKLVELVSERDFITETELDEILEDVMRKVAQDESKTLDGKTEDINV